MPGYDLCVITRNVAHLNRTHLDVARAALEGGATIVQFRDKELDSRALLDIAAQLRQLTRARGATFIVNDRVDIALASDADGVHLGQSDLPVSLARRLMGPRAIIGCSATSPQEAAAAEAAGASYLGVGPVYPTGSKSDAGAAIGPAAIAQIRRAVGIPLLAIGGLTCHNVAEVIAAGADGIAVVAAVAEAPDMVAAAADLRRCVQQAHRARSPQELSP
jgi:thiamine-phosphate pyrophosphorylase